MPSPDWSIVNPSQLPLAGHVDTQPSIGSLFTACAQTLAITAIINIFMPHKAVELISECGNKKV